MTSNVGSKRLLGDAPDTEGVMDDLRRTSDPSFSPGRRHRTL